MGRNSPSPNSDRQALALAEDRRRDIVRKTRDGLAAARARGRPRVVRPA